MNDEAKQVSAPKHGGGVPSRDQLYRKVANKALKAIDVLVEIMETGGGPKASNMLGAAKIILNKALPDLRAQELSGKDGQQLFINLIGDYITKTRGDVSTPNNGSQGSIEVQGPDMAPPSTQDVNVTREDGTRVS